MKLQPIEIQTRTTNGKGAAGRTRQAGNVPGIVYGIGNENVSIIAEAKALEHLLHHGQGEHAMLELRFTDNPDLNGPAMIKEVQHHPVRGNALHVDLMRIDLSNKIVTLVPIKLEGHCVGVVAGGILDHHMRELEVECLPLDTPEFLTADITNMEIGDTLHVSDIIPIENVTILTEDTRTVAAVHQPRVILETEASEAGAEGEGEATDSEESEDDES